MKICELYILTVYPTSNMNQDAPVNIEEYKVSCEKGTYTLNLIHACIHSFFFHSLINKRYSFFTSTLNVLKVHVCRFNTINLT